MRLILNPDTSLEQVARHRDFISGAFDVLGWPKRMVDAHRPTEEVVRAGVNTPPEEEG